MKPHVTPRWTIEDWLFLVAILGVIWLSGCATIPEVQRFPGMTPVQMQRALVDRALAVDRRDTTVCRRWVWTAALLDSGSTIYAVERNPNLREANPFLFTPNTTQRQVLFVGIQLGLASLAHETCDEPRSRWASWFFAGLRLAAAAHNMRVAR